MATSERGPIVFGCRLSSVALAIFMSSGCGLSLGESVQPHSLDRERTVVGPELGYTAYVLNSQGMTVGSRATFFPKRASGCCYEFRAHGEVGYGVLPLPYTSALGFEAGIGPTIGNVGVANEGHFALGGEANLGIPLRVTRSRDLWEVNPKLEPIGLLVPRIGLEMLSPVGNVDHRPITAIQFSLTFRYLQWLTILP